MISGWGFPLDAGALETLTRQIGESSLLSRTGGAPTFAVGMAHMFAGVIGSKAALALWYHFAIMFEALFILTTIDAGTRIARFLVQETAGRVYAPFARQNWLPGALLASALVTGGWGWLIYTGSIDTIWPMFGIANQILAVMALALVTTWIINSGRGKYCFVTLLPMLFVTTTTLTAASQMVMGRFSKLVSDGEKLVKEGSVEVGNRMILTGYLNMSMTVFVVACVITLVLWAVAKWIVALRGSERGVWASR